MAAATAAIIERAERPFDPLLFYDGIALVVLVLGHQLATLLENQRLTRDLEGTVAMLREREQELQHQALHDPLTGLANRQLFDDRIRHALARRLRSQDEVGLLYLDIDGFKAVNDTLGHLVGDALLQAVADRLRESVRPGDTVSRLGGDEFAVLLHELSAPTEARVAAERVSEALSKPFCIHPHEVRVGISVGVALSAKGGTADDLLRAADTAMYHAKLKGAGGFVMAPASPTEEAS